ncbi:MAG: hypothetical protein RLY86_3058 [Pseudomonadota bacterium]|jgi:UDP-GlcNAc:undecaprenyl-phosphate GlcNAc-1-phosphate transferase
MYWMFAVTPIVLAVCLARFPIARSLGLMDMPDGLRKLHGRPVPLVGGIAVMVPFALLGAGFGLAAGLPWLMALSVAGAGLMTLGALDDARNLRPLLRLAVSVALLVAIVWLVPSFQLDQVRFIGGVQLDTTLLAIPATVFCLIALQNGLNMADGMNGLAGSQLLCWALVLAGYALHQPAVFFVLMALAVALFTVLAFNMRGLLFFGDAGSYSISVILGLAAIHLHNSPGSTLTADVVVLLFLVPMVDMARLVVTRLQAGVSPFQGDRNHLHHLLIDAYGQRRALILYLALACTPSMIALAFPAASLVLLVVTVLAYGGMIVGCQVRRLAESTS